MKRSGTYLAGSIAIVGTTLLLGKAFLSDSAWLGLSLAGASALVVQGLLFVGLAGVRKNPKRFAKGVLVGAAARMGVLIIAIVALTLNPTPWAVPFLLGLTAYLVALLWFESLLENLDLLRPRAARQ